ncbi:Nrap protein [Sporodiniella umbellata]|nr:Nrap protein [Sporodiniella umbellata]
MDEDKLPSIEIKKTALTKDDIIAGELEGLKETADLFKSNIFKLEIEELLSEINIKFDKHKALEKALHTLKSTFDEIPKGAPLKLADFAERMLKKSKIVVPFPSPQPSADALHSFAFEKPTATHIVGGYALKTVSKSSGAFNVDIAVEMPTSIFQEKDYSNYRYFHKRVCYLSVLAKAIQATHKFQIEFSTMNGDLRRPVLLVKPIANRSDVDFSKTKCVIRILPSVDLAAFPKHRLAPGKGNVKTSSDSSTPTPLYNTSMLMDTSYTSSLTFFYQHSKICPEFKNAVSLARIWIQQRGLDKIGFTPFLFTMIMTYLMQGNRDGGDKKLSSTHSSYQLFKGTLDFVSTRNFKEAPVFIGEDERQEFAKSEFIQHFDFVVVDPSGTLNMAANIHKSGLAQIQHEAKLALLLLNDSVDRFEPMFLKKVDDIKYKYDHVARIKLPSVTDATFTEEAKANYYTYLPYFVQRISEVLTRGLTDRVDLVSIDYTCTNSQVWSVGSSLPSDVEKNTTINIGLLLNSDNAPRLVDQGPQSQNEDEVAEFRKFWGNKSELRRFKDGSIVEAVVWPVQGYENRSLIVQEIVQFLLGLHLSLNPQDIHYWAGQFYDYLNFAKEVPKHIFNPELKVTGFQSVMTAFNQLSKQLREIDDALPLMIGSIYPASPSVRYTTVNAPHPVDFNHAVGHATTTRYMEAIDIIISIERSSKFPDDLSALQKVKHSFYLSIAQELKKRFQMEAVVVDNICEKNPFAIRGSLDVYCQGHVFRCHIGLEQEGQQLKKIIDSKVSTSHDKGLAKDAYEKYLYQLSYQQSHTFAIQAMCARFTAYSSTVRLTKRWFGTHLLSSHASDEMIELIVAYVFLEPQPWATPVSTFSGFTRVLNLLATFDWTIAPLIVDIDGDLTSKQREEIHGRFKNHRATNPQMTRGLMTIATSKDLNGHRWTRTKPTRPIASRISALAKASLKALDQAMELNKPENIQRVFSTPMSDYSVVLPLNKELCTRYYQNTHPDPKYFKSTGFSHLGDKVYARVDCISDLVEEIEQLYGNTVMVFYNQYGGDRLALVWNPAVSVPVQWKVAAGFNSVPVDMKKNGFLVIINRSKNVTPYDFY